MRTLHKLIALMLLLTMQVAQAQEQVIDLSGSWGFQLDPTDFDLPYEMPSSPHKILLQEKVILPGTTDSNKKGIENKSKPVDRLSRYYEYVGLAFYQKDIVIPQNWAGKSIELFFERILWVSSLYIDGTLIGTEQSFSTPHIYNLSEMLTPGRHRISVCIDNRTGREFGRNSHAFTEHTQTHWNGIVGKMELRAFNRVNIKDIQVYPDIKAKTVKVICTVANLSGSQINGTINLSAITVNSPKIHQVKYKVLQFSGSGKEFKAETILEMGNDVQLWDEFSPVLYNLKASLSINQQGTDVADTKNVLFGMRNISSEGAHLTLNNRKIFLRGDVECAVFPLTGYPDMTIEGWLKILKIAKDYGMNHIRFHSWCPPEAAFVAADQLGMMFEVELPLCTKVTKATDPLSIFLRGEMERILDTYGNHPSFVLLCMGNELGGNFDFLTDLIKFGKEKDSRHLYSGSTARENLPEDQFYVSHVTTGGDINTYRVRGPQTDYDLSKEYGVLKVPGIAHEVGQHSFYPNFDEMKKYTGLLYPRNFEVFRDTLIKHGMMDQAKDFFNVSGNLAVLNYKESIEVQLRTSNCSGFQLLQLNDFPGQGTALVGILDPFWDSKGFITPEKFREFCSPAVPLLRFPKREYFNTETFKATAELYYYDNHPLTNIEFVWDIKTSDHQTIASGKFKKQNIQVSTSTTLGEIKTSLSKITSPQKLTVTVHAGNAIKNEWDIWVYPKAPIVEEKNFIIARKMDESTIEALKNGKNILMLPDTSQLAGQPGSWENHFWNPLMFRKPPDWKTLTMGTLVKNQHPAFKYFPTEFYTNWQWWNIINNAVTVNLEGTPDSYRPLLQSIDTYDRCLKEGIIFEVKVEKGKLLMVCIDFEKDIANRPAAQQLLYSLKRYISETEFNPEQTLPVEFFSKLFKKH